jgi:hypothetical protein
VDEFRVKYLPDDEKQRVARHMTPEEIGEDFARKSLSIAKRDLA